MGSWRSGWLRSSGRCSRRCRRNRRCTRSRCTRCAERGGLIAAPSFGANTLEALAECHGPRAAGGTALYDVRWNPPDWCWEVLPVPAATRADLDLWHGVRGMPDAEWSELYGTVLEQWFAVARAIGERARAGAGAWDSRPTFTQRQAQAEDHR